MLSEATVTDYFKNLLSQSKTQPVCLEQIIMTQIDEPYQRNCIYRLKKRNTGNDELEKTINYTQIEVKSTDFLQ